MSRSARSSRNMSTSPTLSSTGARAGSSTGCSTPSPSRCALRRPEVRERDIIERLKRIATAPEARGLLDDAALLDGLVITHDSIAEGVHFLPTDPPASVGWKLVAVNLSDLAGKGATPAGALLSLTISGPSKWAIDFLSGVEAACESYGLPLIGGDTIALPPLAPRVLGLTAIGRAGPCVPDRAGGKPGDALLLVGTVGDAAGGPALLRAGRAAAGT